MEKHENLSQSKYAEHRNVTKGYIGRLVKEGRLHLIKGKLNVKMADEELDNKSNDDKAPNYWSEKALHEKAKRELAELDLKLKSNQVVEVDQIGDHLDKIFSAWEKRNLTKKASMILLEMFWNGLQIGMNKTITRIDHPVTPKVHSIENKGCFEAVHLWTKRTAFVLPDATGIYPVPRLKTLGFVA